MFEYAPFIIMMLLALIGYFLPFKKRAHQNHFMCFVLGLVFVFIMIHPYKDEFVHVDLIKVDLTQTVEAEVQINYLGIPIGVKEEGGLVQTINNTLRISALPTNIPTSLDIDIAHLNVGENVIASDIELPEGVTLANEEDDSVMVIVTLPRAAVEEEEDLLGEGLEGEEGEASADGESTEETAGDDSSEESAE